MFRDDTLHYFVHYTLKRNWPVVGDSRCISLLKYWYNIGLFPKIITVAFPLSAGSTMTDLSFPMFLMAVLSPLVMFGLGNWVDFSAPQTSARSPSLSSTGSILHAFSVCTMMSFTGNFSGDTAKFRPFARTLISGSDSSLLDRFITHFFSCVPLRSIISVLPFFCSNLLSFCFCLALLWLYSLSCACTNTCFNVSLVSSCTCLKISSVCFSLLFNDVL